MSVQLDTMEANVQFPEHAMDTILQIYQYAPLMDLAMIKIYVIVEMDIPRSIASFLSATVFPVTKR